MERPQKPTMPALLSHCIAVAIAVSIAFASVDAQARRRHRRRHHGHEPHVVAEKSLFERLGGRKALEAVVDDFLKRSAQDSRLTVPMGRLSGPPSQASRLKARMVEQMCEAAGGPCRTSEPSAREAWKTLGLDSDQFIAFAENLGDALEQRKTSEREKNELLGLIGAARGQLVSRSASP